MYINRLPELSMHPRVKVMLIAGGKKIAIEALVDSGATCSTIHPKVTRREQLPLHRLDRPRVVRNADGTDNRAGRITHELDAMLHDGLQEAQQTFAVVDTGNDDVILGIDYLQKHNPEIDWKQHVMTNRKGRHIHFTINTVRTKSAKERLKKKKRKDKDRKRKKKQARIKGKRPAKKLQAGKRQRIPPLQIDEDSDSDSEDGYERMPSSRPLQGPIIHGQKRPRAQTITSVPRHLHRTDQQRSRSPSPRPTKQARTEEVPKPGTPAKVQGTWASNWAPKAVMQREGQPGIQGYYGRTATPEIPEDGADNSMDEEEPVEDMEVKRHWAPQKPTKQPGLNKYSSVAQQYSQQKAAAEGRLQSGEKKEKEAWRKLLPPQIADYADVFDPDRAKRLPKHTKWDMKINLDATKELPKPRGMIKLTLEEQAAVEEYVNEMLEKGWIEKVEPHEPCPVAAPVFFVGKKDGGARMVTDYRDINAITITDPYPIPIMGALPEKLEGRKHFFTLDMRSGYNNLRIARGDEWKAAFRVKNAVYKPKVMMFGMKNSPAVFQRFMNENFDGWLRTDECLIYLDDLIGGTETEEEQWKLLRQILQQCRDLDIYLKIEKCHFNQTKLDYLGFIVSNEGLHMDPYKLKAIDEWPTPTRPKDIKKFLGFCNFYRKFIARFADLVKPITLLTQKTRKFVWGPEQEEAFEKLKKAFREEVTLKYPDPQKPYTLECDASDEGLSGILQQIGPQGELQPVGFFSKTLNSAERNYPIYDKEMLAIIQSLKFWRHLLEGAMHEITIRSDHANLKYFMTAQDLTRRQARYALALSRYAFKIIHWPGKKNKADPLSRRPDYEPLERDNKNITLLPTDRLEKTIGTTDAKGLYILRTEAITLPSDPIIKAIKRWISRHPWRFRTLAYVAGLDVFFSVVPEGCPIVPPLYEVYSFSYAWVPCGFVIVFPPHNQ